MVFTMSILEKISIISFKYLSVLLETSLTLSDFKYENIKWSFSVWHQFFVTYTDTMEILRNKNYQRLNKIIMEKIIKENNFHMHME